MLSEREKFEAMFPMPPGCVHCGEGFAPTSYSAWKAHDYIEQWKGWRARAAIEATATAPLLARIAELEKWQAEHWNALEIINNYFVSKDLLLVVEDGGPDAAARNIVHSVAALEQQLEEARKDAADADSMCEAMKKVIDQNDARWKFLHTTNKDSEGFEWCVLRVKWENGRISEALHTYSNMADLDAAIKEQT